MLWNIRAVYVLDNGNIMRSTVGDATLGGITFGAADLAEYNPTTDVATLYFDESNFSGAANIDSVYVTTLPEPATIVLLGLGMLVLVGGVAKRPKATVCKTVIRRFESARSLFSLP